VARISVVFGKEGGKRMVVQAHGDLENVSAALQAGWTRLNKAPERSEPNWIWVNGDRVLWVEVVPELRFGGADPPSPGRHPLGDTETPSR
jgi:hypothetical protein